MPDGAVALILLIIGCILGGLIAGVIALVRTFTLSRRLSDLERSTYKLSVRLDRPSVSPETPPVPAQTPLPAPFVPPARLATPPPPPESAALPDALDVTPRFIPPRPAQAPLSRPVSPPPVPPSRSDLDAAWWRDLEKRVGQRWMVWAGALVLIIATAVFVKYAFDHEWIGPTARIAMGVSLGLVLLLLGDRSVRSKYVILGQGLIGTALAVLYVSLFAGFAWYHLYPQSLAFGSMILVTVAGVALAILHDSQPLALIAVVGGILSPVLVSTGLDSRDILFSYLLLLDLGVLAVAFFRNWRLLDVVAFIGTLSLYAGWYSKFYADAALVPALLWLGVFFLVFLLLPFLYHLRRSEEAPWTRFLMALSNAVYAFSFAYGMLKRDHQAFAAFLAIALTAAFAVMGSITRRRIPGGAKQLLGFLAIATAFLVLAAPIHFKVDGIVVAWAVEAPVLLYIGFRYRYAPLRIMAFIILALVSVFSLAEAWPEHYAAFLLVLNRQFLTALAVPLAAAAFALLHYRDRSLAQSVDREAMGFAACASGVLALVFLHAELAEWFRLNAPLYQWARPDFYARHAYALLWTLGALLYALVGLRLASLKTRLTGLGVLLASLVMALYLLSYDIFEPYNLFLNSRFLVCALSVALLFFLAWLSRRRVPADPAERSIAIIYVSSASLFLLGLLSVEAYQFSNNLLNHASEARWLALMSVSVVWGLYAFFALGLGIRKRLAPLRYAALVLFAATVVKVLVFDTSEIKDVYRWIVLYATGFLLFAGSYLYYKLEKTISSSPEESAK